MSGCRTSRALDGVWHIPAAPPVTGQEFITQALAAAGRPPKVGVYPRWMMWMAGLFSRQMREILEVMYQFKHPFVLDAQKFSRTVGSFVATPLPEAIATTLEWERERVAPTD